MNHVQLHDLLSKTLIALESRKMKPADAKEIFNGAGKLIANCKNEIVISQMGYSLDIPLMDIKKVNVPKSLDNLERPSIKKLNKKTK